MSDKLKVVFAPGCFDEFDGTQEELNEMIAEIHKLVESGEFMDKAEFVSYDDMTEDERDLYGQLETPRPRRLN